MTISASSSHSHLVPALPPAMFVFHPIGVVTVDDDHTEITCTSSIDNDEDNMDMDVLTPYPAYTTTNEEIQGWKDLEQSLGGNWSLCLAGELTPCEMSLDGTINSDDNGDDGYEEEEEEEEKSTVFAYDNKQFHKSAAPDFQVAEDEETRKNRNLLWKQSLKRSLFTESR